MSNRRKPSTSGLFKNYAGSCVVCLQGTDTALTFEGEAEWLSAGLTHLGIPEDQATVMVSNAFGCPPGMLPDGRVAQSFRVCADCANNVGWSVGLVVDGGEIPCIGQPADLQPPS